MALKVWVKRGGSGDEEALGIHVPPDGTAQSVVEACRGVFRHLQPSRVALRTEDGIIVARASPVTALHRHTLELIEVQPAEAPRRRVVGNHTPTPTKTNINTAAAMATMNATSSSVVVAAVATAPSSARGVPSVGQRSAGVQPQRAPPSPAARKTRVLNKLGGSTPTRAHTADRTAMGAGENVGVPDRLAALWDSLPAFSYPPLARSTPAVTGVLRAARRAQGEALGSLGRVGSGGLCEAVTTHGAGQKLLNGDEVGVSPGYNDPSRLPAGIVAAGSKSVGDGKISGRATGADGNEGLKDGERGFLPSPCDSVAVEEIHTDKLHASSSSSSSPVPLCKEAVVMASASAAVVAAEAEANTPRGNEAATGETAPQLLATAVEANKPVVQLLDSAEERGREAVSEVVDCGENFATVAGDGTGRANIGELAQKLPAYFEEW
ncbi:uncharacterized protein Tco025E_02785 [Trypanosoma conorhini]|uniref:Uncharacterized protein n=1 Tax=Trypanosoma conorhini TaxID=83891 RepID=A0A3R7NKX6_9TRYP|nr:uncharacterized protein Tco025E_02785 [Trypanosoma conorhini]RNF23493.1 hypothetical protein Tco025E_02785 [Trypanosoma conorhini]